ncbi:unnamed protein product [Calypogeia fissa]
MRISSWVARVVSFVLYLTSIAKPAARPAGIFPGDLSRECWGVWVTGRGRERKAETGGIPPRPDRPVVSCRLSLAPLKESVRSQWRIRSPNSKDCAGGRRTTVEMHCLFVCFGSVLPVLSLSRLCCRQIVLFRPAASLFFRIQLVNSLSKAKGKTTAGRGIDGVVNWVGRGRRRSRAPAKEDEEEVEEHTRRASTTIQRRKARREAAVQLGHPGRQQQGAGHYSFSVSRIVWHAGEEQSQGQWQQHLEHALETSTIESRKTRDVSRGTFRVQGKSVYECSAMGEALGFSAWLIPMEERLERAGGNGRWLGNLMKTGNDALNFVQQ